MANASEQRQALTRALRMVERLARACAESGEALRKDTLLAAMDDIAIYANRAASEADNVVPMVRDNGQA